MALKIHYAPDPVLSIRSDSVDPVDIDDNMRQLLNEMVAIMLRDDGVGLAANQVGITKRIIVLNLSEDESSCHPIKLINPEILWRSEETVAIKEGCLSLPGIYPEIIRSREVEVQYLDENGVSQKIRRDGIIGRCLQHEIDHLDGILSIDRLPPLKRKLYLRKMIKIKKAISRKQQDK